MMANRAGITTAIGSATAKWRNGSQNQGNCSSPLHTMKSGNSSDCSFMCIAMLYAPRLKNTPWPRLSTPA